MKFLRVLVLPLMFALPGAGFASALWEAGHDLVKLAPASPDGPTSELLRGKDVGI